MLGCSCTALTNWTLSQGYWVLRSTQPQPSLWDSRLLCSLVPCILCPVSWAEPGSSAALPCFPHEFSLVNLGQDISTFKFLKQGLGSWSLYLLKALNLSTPWHPALYDNGHKMFYSNHSPGQWMPSVLMCNCVTEGDHQEKLFCWYWY